MGRIKIDDKIIYGSITARGYIRVSLHLTNGEWKHKYVHRLVMRTFEGKSDLQVNHLDGNKQNNKLSNLKYDTQSDNIKHAIETGLKKPNLNGKTSKPVRQLTLDGKFIKDYVSVMDAKRQTNIFHIVSVCNGNRSNAGGYKWEYIENFVEKIQSASDKNNPGKKIARKTKSIRQLTLDGKFIKEYPSISAAENEFKNTHIGDVCRGMRNTACGFKWEFVNE